jgi:hypothetical protein
MVADKMEVETTSGMFEVGLVVVESVVAASQMVVDGLSSDQRCLVAGWGQ